MKYYRVKTQYDNKTLCLIKNHKYVHNGYFLIGGELYTEKEYKKLIEHHVFGFSPWDAVEEIEIPKSKIYWFFGARFADC